MRPFVVVDLMSHVRPYGAQVVAAHHRFSAPGRPLRIVGPDAGRHDLGGAAGIQVTGSTCMLKEDAPWARRLCGALERVADDDVPVLGVCFGHQMLGVHFGASLASWPKERVSLAPVRFGAAADGPFAPGEVLMLHTHRDRLTEVGDRLRVVAAGGQGGVQAWRHPDLPIWGIQGHPEADAPLTRRAEGDAVAEYTDAELDTPAAKRILARFGALMDLKGQDAGT